MNKNSIAFGAPGIEPRWTSSAKDGIGTAYHSSSGVWFTLSHGIVNEIYFPHVDSPNTRDLQFLITDGESFCHEERRDLDHKIEYPEQNALFYRLTNSDREGRYRLIKEILVDPHSPVFLMHTRLEILDPKLRGKLRLYALLAPHLKGTGKNNSAGLCGLGGRKLFGVQREGMEMSFGCTPDFSRRSVGYVGFSDGWQDLMDNFKMDWEFEQATDGNIALTGEIDLSDGMEFTLGVGFGCNRHSASAHLLQAFATPFADQREKYVSQWQRTRAEVDLSKHTKDGGSMLRLSQCLLLAHEDKTYQGAFVASLSIPWGDTKDDSDRGGYHLVNAGEIELISQPEKSVMRQQFILFKRSGVYYSADTVTGKQTSPRIKIKSKAAVLLNAKNESVRINNDLCSSAVKMQQSLAKSHQVIR